MPCPRTCKCSNDIAVLTAIIGFVMGGLICGLAARQEQPAHVAQISVTPPPVHVTVAQP